MARAPKLGKFDVAEAKIARDFLGEQLSKTAKAKLVTHENGVWLVNPETKVTYNVMMANPPHPQTGLVRMVFSRAGEPVFGVKGATWLVVFEPFSGTAYLIASRDLTERVNDVIRNPDSSHGMLGLKRDDKYLLISVHMDWATNSRLCRHVIKIGGKVYAEYRDAKMREPEGFVHLHNHSTYSLLDGCSEISAIAKRAYLNGQPGIALTDHGNVFGAYKHWAACKERGVKAIMGCEIYLVDDVGQKYVNNNGNTARFEHHLTLIAMNAAGWENLCKLLTIGGRDHYHYVPRIDFKMLAAHAEGLICCTGCFKGPVAHYLQDRPLREGETKLNWWQVKSVDMAVERLNWLKGMFGDRLYGEVMNIDYAPYVACVPQLLDIFSSHKVPTVLTNDNHYEIAEDAEVQSIMTKVSSQKVDGLGENAQKQGVYFIRTLADMVGGASWVSKEMTDRTVEILDRCSLTFDRDGYVFPPFDVNSDPDWKRFEAAGKTTKTTTCDLGPPKAPITHETHEAHPNSIAALESSKDSMSERAAAVLGNVKAVGAGTDKEIAIRMGFDHKSAVQPRISELVDAGLLKEIGSKPDPDTKKSVRVVAAA
jgi:hypothetical protein